MSDQPQARPEEVLRECRSVVCEGNRTPQLPVEGGLLGSPGWKCQVCGAFEPEPRARIRD